MIYRVGAAVVTSVVMVTCSAGGNGTVAGIPPVVVPTSETVVTTVVVQQAVSEPVRRAQNIASIDSVTVNTSSTSSVPAGPSSGSVNSIQSMTTSTAIVPSLPDDLLYRRYPMYGRGGDVVALQMHLGLKSVDGVYGPQTRKAHISALGGPLAALAVFHPKIDYPVQASAKTLGELIDWYFLPADRAWARQVAFCESSAQTHHTGSEVVSSALAVGWFQHLAKFWDERSEKAGVSGASPFDSEANVAVAAWLFYEGGGARHWNPSRTCWEKE
jgi:hypothetical protein